MVGMLRLFHQHFSRLENNPYTFTSLVRHSAHQRRLERAWRFLGHCILYLHRELCAYREGVQISRLERWLNDVCILKLVSSGTSRRYSTYDLHPRYYLASVRSSGKVLANLASSCISSFLAATVSPVYSYHCPAYLQL